MSVIKLAEDALNRARGCIWGLLHGTPVRDADETLGEIASTLSALEAVQTEPVAWIVSYDGKLPYSGFSQDRDYVENTCKHIGGSARPMALYATPQEAVQTEPVVQQQPTSQDVRSALLFALWHHQGSCSKIGQPIRSALGIQPYEAMTDEQLNCAMRVQSALATPQEAAAPEGWQLVPIEPTPEMFAIDAPAIDCMGDVGTMKYRRGIWNSMLKAAPKAAA